MAEYKVFNPENGVGMHPSARIRELPTDLQEQVRVDFWAAQPRQLHEYERARAELMLSQGTVADLESSGLDIGRIMDDWAIAVAFDPYRTVTPQAAWVLQDDLGRQRVVECHLAESETSPNGLAWKASLFEHDERFSVWHRTAEQSLETHHGMTNAHGFAKQLLEQIAGSRTLDASRIDVTRIPPDMLRADELGVGVHQDLLHGRYATPAELEAAISIDWTLADQPEFPTFDKLAFEGLPELSGVIRKKFGKFDLEAPYRTNEDGTCVMSVSVVNPESHRVVYSTVEHLGANLEAAYNINRNACLNRLLPWKGEGVEVQPFDLAIRRAQLENVKAKAIELSQLASAAYLESGQVPPALADALHGVQAQLDADIAALGGSEKYGIEPASPQARAQARYEAAEKAAGSKPSVPGKSPGAAASSGGRSFDNDIARAKSSAQAQPRDLGAVKQQSVSK